MNHNRSPVPAPQLTRYDSAPGSFLAELSAARAEGIMSRFFSGESSSLTTSESGGHVAAVGAPPPPPPPEMQRAYGVADVHVAGDHVMRVGGGAQLVRHSSSPAGFLSHLIVDSGVSATGGFGSYSQADTNAVHSLESRRLRSQWSFSQQDSLSQISEMNIPEIGENVACGNSSDEAAYISNDFQLGSWEDSNSITFSAPPRKRAKDNNGDIVRSLSNIESQFNMPSSLEYLQLQQDTVPCKVRAKRGFATHPRSIAERERRTRISKRLRKLQDLVPNMDKQTSTSEMLELAVDHIKELQNQLQRLKQEQANCTCGGKQANTQA